MLRDTIQEILGVMKQRGVFIVNYPNSPRYYYKTVAEIKQVLGEYFDIRLLSGNDKSKTSVPIWIMRKK